MMIESVVVAVIVLGAAACFVMWIKGLSTGNRGCPSCGGCKKKCDGGA